jgi:hypothetical protein
MTSAQTHDVNRRLLSTLNNMYLFFFSNTTFFSINMSTEVSVIGVVNNELYQTVLNRLGNHTHSFSHFTSQEIGFDRGQLQTHPTAI